MTGPVTWEIVSGFIALATFFGGFGYRIHGQINSNRDRIDKLNGELASYKLEAANQFASIALMERYEVRMIAAIDRLSSRLDRLIEKHAKE